MPWVLTFRCRSFGPGDHPGSFDSKTHNCSAHATVCVERDNGGWRNTCPVMGRFWRMCGSSIRARARARSRLYPLLPRPRQTRPQQPRPHRAPTARLREPPAGRVASTRSASGSVGRPPPSTRRFHRRRPWRSSRGSVLEGPARDAKSWAAACARARAGGAAGRSCDKLLVAPKRQQPRLRRPARVRAAGLDAGCHRGFPRPRPRRAPTGGCVDRYGGVLGRTTCAHTATRPGVVASCGAPRTSRGADHTRSWSGLPACRAGALAPRPPSRCARACRREPA